jgi:hypothetical protein
LEADVKPIDFPSGPFATHEYEMYSVDFRPDEQDVLNASAYSKSTELRAMVRRCDPLMETEGA